MLISITVTWHSQMKAKSPLNYLLHKKHCAAINEYVYFTVPKRLT